MGDAQWREAERRWRASPSDATLAEAIRVGKRHGVRIPGAMLLAQRFPKRTLSCKEPGWVQVEVESGLKAVGHPPGDCPLQIPRHRMLWFQSLVGAAKPLPLDALLGLAVRESIPGVGIHLPQVSDAELKRMASKAPHLSGVTLHELYSSKRRRITAPALSAIAALPDLQVLRLHAYVHAQGTQVPFAPLRELPHLVDVQAYLTRLEAKAGATLPRHLRRLSIRGAGEPWDPVMGVDAALEGLGGLEELADLELFHTDAADAGLRGLLACAAGRLERLSLEGSQRVAGEALAGLDAPRLEVLDLHSTSLSDRGAALLAKAKLPALTRLDLTNCKAITDAGLGHVAGLGTLRELRLDHCTTVTSKGLVKLGDLEGLERLYLRGSPGTLATWGKGRDKLRRALPNCKIY